MYLLCSPPSAYHSKSFWSILRNITVGDQIGQPSLSLLLMEMAVARDKAQNVTEDVHVSEWARVRGGAWCNPSLYLCLQIVRTTVRNTAD